MVERMKWAVIRPDTANYGDVLFVGDGPACYAYAEERHREFHSHAGNDNSSLPQCVEQVQDGTKRGDRIRISSWR